MIPSKYQQYVGSRQGKWTIIGLKTAVNKSSKFIVRCDCGIEREIACRTNGIIRSKGCIKCYERKPNTKPDAVAYVNAERAREGL